MGAAIPQLDNEVTSVPPNRTSNSSHYRFSYTPGRPECVTDVVSVVIFR